MSPLGQRALEFSERLAGASSMDEAWPMLVDELERFGITNAFYALLPASAPGLLGQDLVYFHSYETAFIEAYDGLIRQPETDWSIQHCLSFETPQRWGDPEILARLTPHQLAIEELAWDFGLKEGLAVPLREGLPLRKGGIGLAARGMTEPEFGKLLSASQAEIEHLCWLFHSVVSENGLWARKVGLSPREKECLLWCAAGLAAKQVATRLGIKVETVNLHLANARRKLGARNTIHAVAKSLVLGLLEV